MPLNVEVIPALAIKRNSSWVGFKSRNGQQYLPFVTAVGLIPSTDCVSDVVEWEQVHSTRRRQSMRNSL